MIAKILEILFWFGILTIFYAYVGYGILLWLIVKLKRVLNPKKVNFKEGFEPEVAFIVPCYNESSIIEEKLKNCLSLDYPKDKLMIIFITDGSNDGTPQMVEQFPEVTLLHENQRRGKAAAENRVMKYVEAPIVIFSDANTMLPVNAVKELIKYYADPTVGAVSGEKRVVSSTEASASSAGEGLYWKYESFLKRFDAELLTIVGAAGELFSFRKELFTPLEEDTILDDFILSLRIAGKGFRVLYEPKAYAMETASVSVKEEMKRKVRICAGGWQSMERLAYLLNPFNHFTLTFQYISHRVLRWSIAPLFLFLLIPINLYLLTSGKEIYFLTAVGQTLFYILALLGYYFENKKIRYKLLFVPYYFFIMNLSVILGFIRYLKGSQSAAWERAQRTYV